MEKGSTAPSASPGPEARDAVLEHLPEIQEIPNETFAAEWLPQAYEEHFGKAPRGRRSGVVSKGGRDPVDCIRRTLRSIVSDGPIEPFLQELEGGGVAVVTWDGKRNLEMLVSFLDELLERLRP